MIPNKTRTRIAVTGIGVVTCKSNNKQEFLQILQNNSNHSFQPSRRIPLNINISVGEAIDNTFSTPKNLTHDNPTARLCLTSALECIHDHLANNKIHQPNGLIVGTSTGGHKICEDFIFSLLSSNPSIDINYRAQGTMASVTRMIADEINLRGRVSTVSTACTSSSNAIAMGCSWIENNLSNCVLAGGGDALCATTMSGFHVLGLTRKNHCKPFASNRPGMTLSDGSAFLILEPLEQVIRENREYYAEILGYGMSSDAYSMTSPSENGEGAIKAMKKALDKAQLTPNDIHYINAHGTGTLYNDRSEAIAIQTIFNNTPVSSIKGLVGHTLGGSGSIEAVASVLSVSTKQAWENYNNYQPAEDCPIQLVPQGGLSFNHYPNVLSNSFAFGGNNCVLIFGKPDYNS